MSLNSKLSNTIRQFEDLRLATMKFAYRIVKLKFCEENKNDFYATFQEFSYSSFKKRYSKSNCQNRRYDLILPQKSSIDLGTVIGNIQCRNFLIFCHSDFTWNQLWSFWIPSNCRGSSKFKASVTNKVASWFHVKSEW